MRMKNLHKRKREKPIERKNVWEEKVSEWWIHLCDDGSFFDILKCCDDETKNKMKKKIPIKI